MGEENKRRIGVDLVPLSEASRQLAQAHWAERDWSGIPVPVPGFDLVLEPRYKHQGLSEFCWKECSDEDGVCQPIEQEPPSQPSVFRMVNSWWNAKYQVNIIVVKDKQGRARFTVRFEDRLAFAIRTLDAAVAWPVEAEQKALKKLSSLIPPEQFDLYVLTGHFPEMSRRHSPSSTYEI